MDYGSQIQNYQRELSINRSIIEQEYWHIGNAVRENRDLADIRTKDGAATLKRLLDDADGRGESRSDLVKTIETIEARVASIGDVKSGISNREQELIRLKEGLADELLAFGSRAFELYAASPQTYLPLCDCFRELDELHRDQFNLETRIDTLEKKRESDPLFKRLVNQTKLQFQKNQQRSIGKKIADAFEKTGRLLADRPDLEDGSYPGLAESVQPVAKQKQKIREIEKILDKHRAELSSLNEELSSLTGKNKSEEHITELQMRISETDEDQRKILTEAGQLCYESLSDAPPESLSEYFGNLQQLLAENGAKEEKIRRLQAAQKILALEEEKARFVMKEEKLTRQKQDLEEQIDRVKATISALDKDIASQGKIRGSEKDLV
jgi:ubiquinone biosynthesis protein UbiJ